MEVPEPQPAPNRRDPGRELAAKHGQKRLELSILLRTAIMLCVESTFIT